MTKNQEIELTNLLMYNFLFEPNSQLTRDRVKNFVNHYVWSNCNKRIDVEVICTNGNNLIIYEPDFGLDIKIGC